MKINDFFSMIKPDGEREQARRTNTQMSHCLKDIEDDVRKIEELQRQLFYKRQQFNMMFKEIGSREFNVPCSLYHLFELNDKNVFYNRNQEENKKDFDDAIQAVVGNFFPKRMWEALEFSDFYQEEYSARALSFLFTWKYGKGKTAQWEINVPNPNLIFQSLFDPSDKKCVDGAMYGSDWKTGVVVIPNYKKGVPCQDSYWVGSAWMNSDVRDIIDAKAKELEEEAMKKEDESHDVRS